jgi:outer membrane protein OmpA-like peptidoglycan-associated protein
MVPVVAPATAAAGAVIRFPSGASDLAADAHGSLDALAQRLAASQDSRVQLVAYASGNDEDANLARRLSLARAIAVRKYLIDQGVRGTRIDVRALGNRNAGNGPADRVDLVVLDR